MNRRDFLTLLASAPAIAQADDGRRPARARRLVLIELKGGNDGLNTLVPYRDAAYRRLRPSLALSADRCLPLDETRALHPALAPLLPAWHDRELAIVEGLGYANPNRSHFRSIDIWHSATDSDVVSRTGWLANRTVTGSDGIDAVVFGNRPAAVAGGRARYVSFDNLDTYVNTRSTLTMPEEHVSNPMLSALSATHDASTLYRALLVDRGLPGAPPGFPDTRFGNWMADTARLLLSESAPPLIKLHLQGFDTHADQLERHTALLAELAQAVTALRALLVAAGLWDNVLIMTYSEFGRRATENASLGSDHGTAAPQLLIGGRVKGGFYGQTPSLSRLEADDLVHTTDFRALYRTVLQSWWQLPVQPSLRSRFPLLDCLHA